MSLRTLGGIKEYTGRARLELFSLEWSKNDRGVVAAKPKRIRQCCLHIQSFFLWPHKHICVLNRCVVT